MVEGEVLVNVEIRWGPWERASALARVVRAAVAATPEAAMSVRSMAAAIARNYLEAGSVPWRARGVPARRVVVVV